MPEFSKRSKERLITCHTDLITLMSSVIDDFDFAVICGHRNEKDQNAAYNAGNSKLTYPKSKHNSFPSLAVDIAPVKYNENGSVWIDWNDLDSFERLYSVVKSHADKLNIAFTWGGFWKMKDRPHYELKSTN